MTEKVLPRSRNPNYLPCGKRILNNVMSNFLITPTWCCGFSTMFFNLLIFAGVGYILYRDADTLNDFEVRYDEICASVKGTGLPCQVTFTPDVDLKNPKVYYRLNNFYMNHRSFQKFSYKQLRGEAEADVDIEDCDPVKTNKDMLDDLTKWDISRFFTEEQRSQSGLEQNAWPCGYIAKFVFNDIFMTVKSSDRSFSVQIDDSDIAHPYDIENRFIANEEMKEKGAYWLPVDNEHLIVWYQMETLKDFVKLYGRIDGTMKAGKEYTITVIDNYDASIIGNEKSIYLTEVGTFGSRNFLLPYIFLIAAAVTLAILVFFVVAYFMCVEGRRIEEESYIKNLKY